MKSIKFLNLNQKKKNINEMNNNIKSQIYYFSSIYLHKELSQYKQQFLFIIFFPCSFIYQILNNFFCPTYHLTYSHAYN